MSYDLIHESAEYLSKKISHPPDIAFVLGSGLGDFAHEVKDPCLLPYSEIPHFKKCSVEGHSGQLIFGKINQANVVLMQGRFHLYEGYSPLDVVFPIRVFAKMGIKKIVLTNAAGGINSNYHPGDLVLITDHINFTGNNPLIGKNLEEFGPRFLDMGETYHKPLIEKMKKIAETENIKLHQGIYAGVTGPTYETPAEVRMLKTLGADLVGMSTVYEAIVAHHAGLKVLGLSCVTNYAAGLSDAPLSHDDIADIGKGALTNFSKLIKKIL